MYKRWIRQTAVAVSAGLRVGYRQLIQTHYRPGSLDEVKLRCYRNTGGRGTHNHPHGKNGGLEGK